MEEADALCNRIGIMINGQLECLGTTQHLKTRFGNGYHLEVKLASMKEAVLIREIDKLHEFIYFHFPSTYILEQFGPRVAYKISANEVTSLAKSFEILELAKKKIDIGEYNFSQATLEQVFLEFAKYQMEETNTGDEQIERSHEIARSRKVSALHSKTTSSARLSGTKKAEDDGSALRDAVNKYFLDVKKGVQDSNKSSSLPQMAQVENDDKLDKDSDLTTSRSHFTSIYIPLPTPMHQADVTIKPSLKQSSQSLRMGRMMARVNKKESAVKFEKVAVSMNREAGILTEVADETELVTQPSERVDLLLPEVDTSSVNSAEKKYGISIRDRLGSWAVDIRVSVRIQLGRSLNANPLPRKVDKELYTSPVSRSQRLCELLISSSLEQDQMTG
ncbi:ABCA5 [Bugula neritina]|uniref:ABCA5 n=1 Tax=Bugula neritina TaxID=10212 RepID=A0A7J7JY38_BUGNE|nr:ABCA5 [Bugula neritina]